MYVYWIAIRYLIGVKRKLTLTSHLGVLGLAVGVASLFVSMAVVSGYETTLRQNIIDVSGHLLVVRQEGEQKDLQQIQKDLASIIKEPFQVAQYTWLEGLIAKQGQLSGIFLEGVEPKGVSEVLNFKHRIVKGEFSLETLGVAEQKDEAPGVLVGIGLARRYQLDVGTEFKIVVPFTSQFDQGGVRRKVKTLRVSGVVELGRHEFNERYIMAHQTVVKSLLENPERITGVRVKLANADRASHYKSAIHADLGYPYWAKSWADHEQNIFEAVALEKVAIFFVIFIMVIVASFNITSSIFVNIYTKFREIAVLRSLGMTRGQVVKVFLFQGLVIGFLGSVSGVILGFIFSWLFILLQKVFPIIPAETYRISFINIDIRSLDLIIIIASSMVMCGLASVAPALKGATLNPVEGLRYE